MTDEVEKPDGFIFEEVELAPSQPIVRLSKTRATQLTKMAIQYYLEQYFNATGNYHAQIRELAPYFVQYETGITGTARQDDPSVYELQLARFWSNLKTKLPCILIIDTGYRINSVGLGGVVEGYNFGEHQGLGLRTDATITITLEVAANDETTASDLRDVLSMIFSTLTNFNRAHVIKPEDRTTPWEVRLPLRFDSQGLERRQVPSDNLDVYWSSSLVLDVDFEGVSLLSKENPNNIFNNNLGADIHVDPSFDDMDSVAPSVSLSIRVPSTVYLRQPTQIYAAYVPYKSVFLSDNPNVLLIHGDTMLPRKMGSCNVLLVGQNGATIASYPVTVTV